MQYIRNSEKFRGIPGKFDCKNTAEFRGIPCVFQKIPYSAGSKKSTFVDTLAVRQGRTGFESRLVILWTFLPLSTQVVRKYRKASVNG
jgi:hypothetical protein